MFSRVLFWNSPNNFFFKCIAYLLHLKLFLVFFLDLLVFALTDDRPTILNSICKKKYHLFLLWNYIPDMQSLIACYSQHLSSRDICSFSTNSPLTGPYQYSSTTRVSHVMTNILYYVIAIFICLIITSCFSENM